MEIGRHVAVMPHAYVHSMQKQSASAKWLGQWSSGFRRKWRWGEEVPTSEGSQGNISSMILPAKFVSDLPDNLERMRLSIGLSFLSCLFGWVSKLGLCHRHLHIWQALPSPCLLLLDVCMILIGVMIYCASCNEGMQVSCSNSFQTFFFFSLSKYRKQEQNKGS